MNRRPVKWLAALLIAALLSTPVAIMEAAEQPQPEIEEPIESTIEEDVEEDAPEIEAVEAIDAVVDEEEAVELVETPAYEAQLEETPVEDEPPAEEAPSDASAATEVVVEEADEAEKLMEPADDAIPIDASHFPDDAFRSYVSDFDTDGSGELSEAERSSVSTMELSRQLPGKQNNFPVKILVNAHSLQGIEFFPNLSNLYCVGLSLGALDVSQNTNLASLNCESCKLATLNLGVNSRLYSLNCVGNQLTALDISGCPHLNTLQTWDNSLASLDISACPSLVAAVNPSSLTTQYDVIVIAQKGRTCSFLKYTNDILNCDFSTTIIGGSPVPCVQIKSNGGTTYTTTVGSVFYLYKSNPKRKWNVQWAVTHAKSSKGSVVSKAAEGVWVANAAGKSKLTYKGKKIATIKVVADPSDTTTTTVPENAITVTKNMKYWVDVGTFHQIYLNGKTGKSFKSSNKNVATVDQSGNIAAVGGGKTKITFKVGKKKRTLTLIVVDPTMPTAVYLDKTGTVAAKVGETQALTAAVPEGATTDFTWKSSNKKVATVSNGVVTFKKKGKVTITVTTTRGKKKAKVKFNVSK